MVAAVNVHKCEKYRCGIKGIIEKFQIPGIHDDLLVG
jgi:hypothetical protein